MTSSRKRSSWDWIDAGVRQVENVLVICLLAAIIVDVLLQVLFRYVLSNPLSWSSEVATYMFAWLTLIGIAIAQRDRAHIEVRLFAHLSEAIGIATAWVAWITSFLFFAVLAVAGYLFASGELIQTGPASGIYLWVVYACMPAGAALGLYHTLRDLPQLIRAPLSLASAQHSEEVAVR
jgi:TRAP-type transport system small permease protein